MILKIFLFCLLISALLCFTFFSVDDILFDSLISFLGAFFVTIFICLFAIQNQGPIVEITESKVYYEECKLEIKSSVSLDSIHLVLYQEDTIDSLCIDKNTGKYSIILSDKEKAKEVSERIKKIKNKDKSQAEVIYSEEETE